MQAVNRTHARFVRGKMPVVELNTWWTDDPEQRFWMETTAATTSARIFTRPRLRRQRQARRPRTRSYARSRTATSSFTTRRTRTSGDQVVVRGPRRLLGGRDASGARRARRDRPATRSSLIRVRASGTGCMDRFRLPEPLTLEELREAEATVRHVRAEIDGAHPGAIYYPFQLVSDGLRSAAGLPLEDAEGARCGAAEARGRSPPLHAPPPEVPLAGRTTDDLGDEYIAGRRGRRPAGS